jgi:hypothetical protein
MMRNATGVVLAGLLLLAAAKAGAQMYCEGRLVGIGDSEERVLELCGEPTRREVRSRGLDVEDGVELQQIPTEEWTYDLGPDEFVRHLLFENGTLEQIRQGGYGDGEGE